MTSYSSAKQNRRSVAGSSLLRQGANSFTHQVFRPNMTATQLDSIDSERETPNWSTRASGYRLSLETTERSVAAESDF